jgi:hypothetical protein
VLGLHTIWQPGAAQVSQNTLQVGMFVDSRSQTGRCDMSKYDILEVLVWGCSNQGRSGMLGVIITQRDVALQDLYTLYTHTLDHACRF